MSAQTSSSEFQAPSTDKNEITGPGLVVLLSCTFFIGAAVVFTGFWHGNPTVIFGFLVGFVLTCGFFTLISFLESKQEKIPLTRTIGLVAALLLLVPPVIASFWYWPSGSTDSNSHYLVNGKLQELSKPHFLMPFRDSIEQLSIKRSWFRKDTFEHQLSDRATLYCSAETSNVRVSLSREWVVKQLENKGNINERLSKLLDTLFQDALEDMITDPAAFKPGTRRTRILLGADPKPGQVSWTGKVFIRADYIIRILPNGDLQRES